jgi:hypothetical protein
LHNTFLARVDVTGGGGFVTPLLSMGRVINPFLYWDYSTYRFSDDHLCNHILLQSGCGTWGTTLYTVRGVGSGSRDRPALEAAARGGVRTRGAGL